MILEIFELHRNCSNYSFNIFNKSSDIYSFFESNIIKIEIFNSLFWVFSWSDGWRFRKMFKTIISYVYTRR